MNDTEHFRMLRWLLLLWVGLVAIWGLLGVSAAQSTFWGGTSLTVCQKPVIQLMTHDLSQNSVFLLLIGIHALLLWRGVSGGITRRLYWLYFPLQGALVLGASLVVHQVNIMLNLYLALTLGAIIMLRQARIVIGVAGSYILLILLYAALNLTPWYHVKSSWPLMSQTAIWINLWNTSDYMALILFVAGYLMLYVQQTRIHAQLMEAHDQLAAAHSQLKVSTRRIEDLSRIAERQRLARELHDTLAQGIAGVMMQIQVAHSHLGMRRYERAQQVMQQAIQISREMLANARRAIDDLRTTLLASDDLMRALQEEMSRFMSKTGITCTANALELLACLPASAREHILRIVSEALNNVERHARASHVWIECEQRNALLTIEVRDDGEGFDPAGVQIHAGHYGLLGLRERARLIDGTIEIVSSPGQGTRLRFRLPGIKQEEGVAGE
ncbi:sensor histidine kinase [Ktedonobacter robiniae]|uniref:Histidine kinase n=1 Tax=Ktedonobacter robiniae TaxID=2778365 RepID=A0ABQ3UP63_9CHLR|nr:sensor histidine kinase [Ktedonobacter robiniae]GHO54466.1 histidine kinase [Ktedonobacter robiniae]